MAKHKTFTVATNVKVYFCHPGNEERTKTQPLAATISAEENRPLQRACNPNWKKSHCV